MDRQSQFIQGYRVLYRQSSGLPSPGPWLTQDVKVPSERGVVLAALKKGIVYEIKARPYFNEFQGMDSESRTARTTEEGTMACVLCMCVLVLVSFRCQLNSTQQEGTWSPWCGTRASSLPSRHTGVGGVCV